MNQLANIIITIARDRAGQSETEALHMWKLWSDLVR